MLNRSTKEHRRPATLSLFARSLRREWRRLSLPDSNATIVVAVSGGADSATLLFALDELINADKLKITILVAHLNHKLRGARSDDDARWVRRIAKKLGHDVIVASADVKTMAAKSRDNLEQAARRARYDFLQKVASRKKAIAIVTGHTMDDQAETVLMNLLRGSGTTGLSGIEPIRQLNPRARILLARPLLTWATRTETEGYCRQHSIEFRMDEMNNDEAFTRVRVRQQVVPLLKSFNPKFVAGIARTAELLRDDAAALDSAAMKLIESSRDRPLDGQNSSLRADVLETAEPALRRRALRRWIALHRGDLRRLELIHIAAIEKLIFNRKSGRIVELPGGARVLRKGGRLHYRKRSHAGL